MSFGWLVFILACELATYAVLTRRWHRAALRQLADTADTFAQTQDLVAFIISHLIAAMAGLFFAWQTSSWLARVVVFAVFFWETARLLRFISLLVVVRYAGISPSHILDSVLTPQAKRDRVRALRTEALQLMSQLQLDEETREALKARTLLGNWADEEEQVVFLKHILKCGKVLNRETLEEELRGFRIQSLTDNSAMESHEDE